MRIKIDYMTGEHANEFAGLFTHGLLKNDPATLRLHDAPPGIKAEIPGVRSRIVHQEAWLYGMGAVRFMGDSEIQSTHYSDSNELDPETRAGALVLSWLGSDCYDENAVVLSDHNNKTPGLKFARIGSVASRRTIAAAHIVGGFDRFLVYDDSFSEEILTGVVLDEPIINGVADVNTSKSRYAGLFRLAGESPESLDDYYKKIISQLTFYRCIDIPTLDKNSEYADYLEEIEGIEVNEAFTPLGLSRDLRERFGVKDKEAPVSLTWGHDGMAPIIDEAGRQLYFGAILCEITCPEPAGGIWVRQVEMSRVRAAA